MLKFGGARAPPAPPNSPPLLWHLTNSMEPQSTVRMVQGWMFQPMESGVVNFYFGIKINYVTTSHLPTETRHWQQCIGNMNLRRSRFTSINYNILLLLPLFWYGQWSHHLFTSVWYHYLHWSVTLLHTLKLYVGYNDAWDILPSFIHPSNQILSWTCSRSHTAIDSITIDSHI